MLATRNLSEAVAADELSAAGTPLMNHPRLIHQPTASNKLSCGWTTFTPRVTQPVQNGFIGIARQDKGGSMAL
jgi:hypothetical protein